MAKTGRTIAFYSVTSGVGQSHLLASIAWILASNGRRVLAIDWNTQDPSLHGYFYPFLSEDSLVSSPGLIDLVWGFAQAARALDSSPIGNPLASVLAVRGGFPEPGHIDLLPARGQTLQSSVRAQYFNWGELFDTLGGERFVSSLFREAVEEYDAVLVDCSSGNISSPAKAFKALPLDCLATCFTFRESSIVATVGAIQAFRRIAQSPVARIFPIPMRVGVAEKELLQRSRERAKEVFSAAGISWGPDYWGSVEIADAPYYRMIEPPMLPISEDVGNPMSLMEIYLRVARWLADDQALHPAVRVVVSPKIPPPVPAFDTDMRPYEGDAPCFVSYARSDMDRILPILSDLARLGLRIWWDAGIPGGIEWERFLEAKISKSTHLLIFITQQAVRSDHVLRELQFAQSLGKPLLGVKLDVVALPRAFVAILGRYQMLNAYTDNFPQQIASAMQGLGA